MLTINQRGDFSNLTSFLERAKEVIKIGDLNKYGQRGVTALKAATPIDSGKTADSWYYKIEHAQGSASLVFCNSNIQNGTPIAIILQYGHATRNGSWVEGRDYINPALRPILDELANQMWKEVAHR